MPLRNVMLAIIVGGTCSVFSPQATAWPSGALGGEGPKTYHPNMSGSQIYAAAGFSPDVAMIEVPDDHMMVTILSERDPLAVDVKTKGALPSDIMNHLNSSVSAVYAAAGFSPGVAMTEMPDDHMMVTILPERDPLAVDVKTKGALPSDIMNHLNSSVSAAYDPRPLPGVAKFEVRIDSIVVMMEVVNHVVEAEGMDTSPGCRSLVEWLGMENPGEVMPYPLEFACVRRATARPGWSVFQ